ncbi:MAG TPA: rhomboid family intramembrane serine protease [Gemmataceae bacterium]|jgi:GlpG protein|nr:rhomboid family intramembrane serine protease [Gemmataceae bacterium]
MRQLATLPTEDQARAFADYLLTLRVETRLEPEAGGWVVWVCDEDRVALARAELEQFTRDPSDARYSRAGREAEALRRKEDEAERAYARRQVAMRDRFTDNASVWRRPWTTALIAACVLVALLTGFGKDKSSATFQALAISSFRAEGGMIYWPWLEQVRRGEVWRLVTPIFLHFDLLHLVFNVLMLNALGGVVEVRRGPVRYLLLVLVLAVASNLGEYYAAPHWVGGLGLQWGSGPTFGGMSGVNYGLFGYVWMRARYDPGSGFAMSSTTVVLMIGWFFLCLTGWLGSIANMAHTVGLLLGLLIGVAPHVWRSLRRRA